MTAANNSVSQAAGARTVYTIGFTAGTALTSTTQSTGTITITFPNNTDVTQIFAIDIRDGATQVGNFCSHTAAGVNPPVLTCNIFNGSRVNAGDAVSITLDQVTNPGVVANPTVSLFTSAEAAPVNSAVSQNYQVVGQNPITNVTAANNQVTQALGARTVYTIGFKTSSTGGMSGAAGSQFTITFPNNTDVTKIFTIDIRDGATQVGNFCSHTAAGVNPPVLTCNIFNGSVVNPGDTVTTTLDEVVNPTTTLANPTVSVATTSDTAAVSSATTPNYQVVGQNPITNVTAANNQVTQALGARTVYTIGFKTSSTGGMSGAAGSQFTITFPNNTDVTKIFTIDIRDGATQVGNFCSHTAAGVNPPVLTCNIFNGSVVNPGDTVTTTLDEVVNPTTTSRTRPSRSRPHQTQPPSAPPPPPTTRWSDRTRSRT